ncbi:intradiol ring-cleavage dioxygenase [Desertibaculum subflavum]|uniref:dioxygenase family protein n=1 Tax=Desertibaculum subflavum TaxID=2268458 RepID=UPI000E66E558
MSRLLTRRAALIIAAPAVLTLSRAALAACDPRPTPAETAGPYYKAGAPERQMLVGHEGGKRLVLSGQVTGADCRPVPGALLDFWQADEAGRYDNQGWALRGWQRADGEGRFRLETVVPGLYPGRTRHLHVKVGRPDGPRMTTQLYFPDEPGNRRDGLFRPELLMRVADARDGKEASFDFMLSP